MQQALVDSLIDLLDLESIEVNIFRGVSPDEDRQRIFGGQVAGQALVAAARTVDDERPVHSLHAYFLRPGDPTVPVLYEVDRIRDGRSFTTRRVVAIRPENLPTREERFAAAGLDDRWGPSAIDMRYVTTDPLQRTDAEPPTQQVWLRTNGELPDGLVLHTCLLTYASDMTLLDSSLLPHGRPPEGELMMASLDHAMWFHGPFRADEWLLYDQHTPSASGGRGLATGRVFTSDGRLIANVVQEGLIRRISPS
jgi:acyl-CoA thioesterase-2